MKKNFYADCEYDGLGGALLSFAIINEQNEYVFFNSVEVIPKNPWVISNLPDPDDIDGLITLGCKGHITSYNHATELHEVQKELTAFFAGYTPNIIVDWPDDIKYISELLITGPGTMINIPRITFELKRVEPYPTDIVGAVQHNALWDAYVLKEHLLSPRDNVLLLQIDKPNRNGHLYTKTAVLNAIEDLKYRPMFGVTHPISPSQHINLNEASHHFTNLHIDDGWLKGTLTILNTPQGLVLRKLMSKNLVEFGLSAIWPSPNRLTNAKVEHEKNIQVVDSFLITGLHAFRERA